MPDPTEDVIPPTQREDTDNNLRDERDKTDEQLAIRTAIIEANADHVVEVARERADNVLEVAREKVDATSPETEDSAKDSKFLSSTRASEDRDLAGKRAAADTQLEKERVGQRLEMSRLLQSERDSTDESLLVEREHSDRAVASRDDFLAVVSHDARDILAGIAMSANLLLRLPSDGPSGQSTRVEAQRIRRLAGRMNRLIGDLVDVVSLELGMLKVETREEDASRLVTETMEHFQGIAAARDIVMTCDVGTESIIAKCDHDRILQVLANLVGNALKFTEPSGTIAIVLAPFEDRLEFTVRDSGCGIASKYLDTIFERFSQAAQADRRGLGLGLYISRCIIEAHGGTIWAESESGKGSAFHFTLPVS